MLTELVNSGQISRSLRKRTVHCIKRKQVFTTFLDHYAKQDVADDQFETDEDTHSADEHAEDINETDHAETSSQGQSISSAQGFLESLLSAFRNVIIRARESSSHEQEVTDLKITDEFLFEDWVVFDIKSATGIIEDFISIETCEASQLQVFFVRETNYIDWVDIEEYSQKSAFVVSPSCYEVLEVSEYGRFEKGTLIQSEPAGIEVENMQYFEAETENQLYASAEETLRSDRRDHSSPETSLTQPQTSLNSYRSTGFETSDPHEIGDARHIKYISSSLPRHIPRMDIQDFFNQGYVSMELEMQTFDRSERMRYNALLRKEKRIRTLKVVAASVAAIALLAFLLCIFFFKPEDLSKKGMKHIGEFLRIIRPKFMD